MCRRRKNGEQKKREKKKQKRFKFLEIVLFVEIGFAVASGFGNAIYRYVEYCRSKEKCKTKKLCEEKGSRFVLWRKDRKNNSCKTERGKTQICEKKFDLFAPYEINGFIFQNEELEKNELIFDFEFKNLSKKKVIKIEVIFFVLDENGEPPLSGRNMVVLNVEENVDSGTWLNCEVDISEWIEFEFDKNYIADFLFVSCITYEDDSKWIDDTGLFI